MKTGVEKLDAYFEALEPEQRAVLAEMRALIHAAQPNMEDAFSYGVPAVRHEGKLALLYAAFKGHYGLYPYDEAVIEALIEDLEGYDIAKGTIRFPLDEPLPTELISKVVRTKIKFLDASE